ncbi:MAG: M24 family metallopeptidase, partial [Myxococcota bacterium]
SVDEAIESGAHGVFYPHGTGHHLGLDVHDLENFGDRPSYPLGQSRPPQFGTRYLRLDLPLKAGWVVTVEPGFYVVPAILNDASLRDSLGSRVNWERARDWIGFGGIRTEDDVVVTDTDPEVLSAGVAKTVAEIEALVGSGLSVEERLC